MNTTKEILLMLAKDGGVHKFDNCEIHVTVVESAKPDYSHLVGKWVKALPPDILAHKTGKYYRVHNGGIGFIQVVDETGDTRFKWTKPYNCFDLSNPLDHNPDFIPVPSEVKFAKFEDGSLGLIHGNNKLFTIIQGEYIVDIKLPEEQIVKCHLEPCKLEDVKVGEFAYLGDFISQIGNFDFYNLKTNTGLFFVSDRGGIMPKELDWNLCYRVVAD